MEGTIHRELPSWAGGAGVATKNLDEKIHADPQSDSGLLRAYDRTLLGRTSAVLRVDALRLSLAVPPLRPGHLLSFQATESST